MQLQLSESAPFHFPLKQCPLVLSEESSDTSSAGERKLTAFYSSFMFSYVGFLLVFYILYGYKFGIN